MSWRHNKDDGWGIIFSGTYDAWGESSGSTEVLWRDSKLVDKLFCTKFLSAELT